MVKGQYHVTVLYGLILHVILLSLSPHICLFVCLYAADDKIKIKMPQAVRKVTNSYLCGAVALSWL